MLAETPPVALTEPETVNEVLVLIDKVTPGPPVTELLAPEACVKTMLETTELYQMYVPGQAVWGAAIPSPMGSRALVAGALSGSEPAFEIATSDIGGSSAALAEVAKFPMSSCGYSE